MAKVEHSGAIYQNGKDWGMCSLGGDYAIKFSILGMLVLRCLLDT